MSDTATPTEPTTDAPDAGTEAPEAPAQETDWTAEARKWETRSKANKTALDELTGKYESVTAERDTLAQKVAEFEAKEQRATLAAEISEATGVPAAALRGDTREELEAHAVQLKSLLPTTAPAIPGAAQKPSSPAPVDPARDTVRKLFGTS